MLRTRSRASDADRSPERAHDEVDADGPPGGIAGVDRGPSTGAQAQAGAKERLGRLFDGEEQLCGALGAVARVRVESPSEDVLRRQREAEGGAGSELLA